MKYLRQIYKEWSFIVFVVMVILIVLLALIVEHCHCGWYWYLSIVRLTRREVEVLRLIAAGRSTKQIARETFRSIKTTEKVRARIKEKLGIKTIAELSTFYKCYVCEDKQ